ncbi:hypothetical protein Ddye_005944 [Dipteronia dyeriana]|uniref:Uncharacterized protein n=1 Tax=Dipteronia dyeriana TaxID=168575 RepID=A0AAE0CQA0_9ROSI|nr:hypothetical protein Ddye_005944 [Dipteronia dyeriana]
MRHFSRIKSEVVAVVEIEADFAYDDQRLTRRWKRRCIAHENRKMYSRSNNATKQSIIKSNKENDVDMEIVTIDSDYENFFNDMEQLVVADDVHSVDDDVNCDVSLTLLHSDDGDILEPHYMMFLDNLKADGNSYVLTLPFSSGTPLVVKYEKDDEFDLENLGTLKGFAVKENIKGANILKGLLERENVEGQRRILESSSGREKIESPKEFLRSDSRRENDETLSNLPYAVKRVKTGNPRTFRNALRKKNKEVQKTLRNVRMIDRKTPVVEKNVEMEAENLLYCTTKDHKSDFMDESYQEFLNSLEEVGQNLVYAPEGGEKLVYEKDEASDSDSEIIILNDNPYSNGNCTPFVQSKLCVDVEDDGFIGRLPGCKESQFREKLMKILQKPYDHKEFKDLKREASRRRPKKLSRELRGVTKTCTLKSLGKSYLDEYKDLAKKIDEVRDRRRVLKLLRGFFFWLQNLSFEDGAFKPWLDASCYA